MVRKLTQEGPALDHYHDRLGVEGTPVDELGGNETFVTQLVTNETFVTEIVNNEVFVTEIAHNETFITEIVNETFLTELTENNTYVTNVTQQINANINGKKGIANELATLDANSQHTPAQIPPGSFALILEGGGAAITPGVKLDFEVPFACNLTGWTLMADQAGDIVIDIWKDSYANFPPTVEDSISTSKPTLSGAAKNRDTTITDWSEALVAGDILRFNVDSATTVTRVTLSLTYQRT